MTKKTFFSLKHYEGVFKTDNLDPLNLTRVYIDTGNESMSMLCPEGQLRKKCISAGEYNFVRKTQTTR